MNSGWGKDDGYDESPVMLFTPDGVPVLRLLKKMTPTSLDMVMTSR